CLKLPRHLEGDMATFAHPAKKVGALGLKRTHGGDILPSQSSILLLRIRHALSFPERRLEPIEWLVRAKVARQKGVAQRVDVRRRHTEERGARSLWLNRNHGWPVVGTGIAPNHLSQLLDRRGLEQPCQRDPLPEDALDLREQT